MYYKQHNSSTDKQNEYCMDEIIIAVDMHLRKEGL